MPHDGEYVDRSGKKRVHFEDSDSEYDRPTFKRKVSETVSLSTIQRFDKTSKSHTQVAIFFSNSGHPKDRGDGSKTGSARKRKSEVGESLSRVGYHRRAGHSTAGGEK